MGHPQLDALLKVFRSDVGDEVEEVEQKSRGGAPKGLAESDTVKTDEEQIRTKMCSLNQQQLVT